MPCAGCNRHVRATESRCPFCEAPLALSEPLEEWRLLTRLDRGRMVAFGAMLSAAGIALGCRQEVGPTHGAPPPSPPVVAPTSAEPPPPAPTPKQTATPPTENPPGAPAAAYGAPPAMPGPGSEPSRP